MNRLTENEKMFIRAAKHRMNDWNLPEDIRIRDMQTAIRIIKRLGHEKESWERTFRLGFNNATIDLNGLIDTGNKLKELTSRLPERAVKPLPLGMGIQGAKLNIEKAFHR